MSTQVEMTRLVLNRIFHPSDFTPASEVAFAHALKLALIARAELSLMHVAPDVEERGWSEFPFPGSRTMLARWGLIPEHSTRADVAKLGLNIQHNLSARTGCADAMLHYLAESPADLLVLATHQHEGFARWWHPAVAEPLVRRAETMTLFVPQGAKGFVALDDGAVTLRRILTPLAQIPRAQDAVAVGLTQMLGCHEAIFTLMHVGPTGEMPVVHEPRQAGWTWNRTVRRGEVVEQILDVGTACAADLIVLTTQGHQGFLDALRGSTSERILRGVRCPVLAVPVN